MVVVVETNLGFAGQGRAGSQEDTKGGVASVASALELATRKQVATSEGAAVSRKRCYVAKDQFMHF